MEINNFEEVLKSCFGKFFESNIRKDFFFKRKKNFSYNAKKGISPVIATMLMVIITISLVGFAYTFLSDFVTTGANTAQNQTSSLIQNPQISINSVWNESGNIGVSIASVGTTAVNLKNMRVFVNNAPKTWTGASIDGCNNSESLVPGASCNIVINEAYNIGSKIKISVAKAEAITTIT